ncbi:MAG TPA: PAS domain-containing protein [Terriglobales bacterium]|nr:PAS domain-containing protein [Terriglobales bacterium]
MVTSLEHNPAIFRDFADLLPFGAYVVDTNHKVLFWNKRAEQITGYLSQDILGRKCGDGMLDHCSPGGSVVCGSDHCPLEKVTHAGETFESKLFLRHIEGHRVPVLVRTFLLRDERLKSTLIAQVFQEESVGPDGLCWISEHIDRFDQQMGLPSVVASRAQLQLSMSLPKSHSAALVVEIERLREMAINRGREMANVALRALAQTVSRVLTVPHYLGCWTGSRLLVVVPNSSPELLQTLNETLENAGSACGIMWWGERVVCRVRAQGVMLEEYDSVESLLRVLAPDEELPERASCS